MLIFCGEVVRVRGSRKKREQREVESCTIKVSKKRELSERCTRKRRQGFWLARFQSVRKTCLIGEQREHGRKAFC